MWRLERLASIIDQLLTVTDSVPLEVEAVAVQRRQQQQQQSL